MKKSDREEIKKLEKLIKAQSKKIKALKHSDEKLTKIKFVNVFFDLIGGHADARIANA